jgi:NAD-dependent deacetylase
MHGGGRVSDVRLSDELVARLRRGAPILVLTGAGVSAESGLATFRGAGGLWEGRNPLELATPQAFAADPHTVWRFYAWRRERAAAAEPNPAHRALAALEAAHPDFRLVTQNVDGLHERAGSRRLVRLHGTLWRLRCVAEGREFDDRRADLGALPPRCACGALLRPAVVWFGEGLPAEALAEAERAARRASVVLVVGTSATVYPAAALPALARGSGARIVEVNPEPTPLSALADERFAAPASRVVPAIARAAGVESAA